MYQPDIVGMSGLLTLSIDSMKRTVDAIKAAGLRDKVKYLNFEFYSTPTNIELINREVLEKYDKFIAPGVASTKSVNVESVDEVLTLLRRVHEKAGGGIDFVSADCGFGGLRGILGNEEQKYRVFIEKLRNVVEAVKRFLHRA